MLISFYRLFGGMFGGLAMQYGRKRVLAFMSLPFSLSWFLTVFAKSVETMFMTAFIAGFCCSIVSMVTQVNSKINSNLLNQHLNERIFLLNTGLRQWNLITRYTWIFKCHTKSFGTFGISSLVPTRSLLGLASTCIAYRYCTSFAIRDCDFYSRNTELFSLKRTWWRCISVSKEKKKSFLALLWLQWIVKLDKNCYFFSSLTASLRSLQWLRGTNKNVEVELETIRSNIRASKFNLANSSNINGGNLSTTLSHNALPIKQSFKSIVANVKAVLRNARLVRPILITCGLMIFQRFTGQFHFIVDCCCFLLFSQFSHPNLTYSFDRRKFILILCCSNLPSNI